MSNKFATSGNSGPKVRSDCEVNLEITEVGGIVVDLQSRVKVMYGESIRKQCHDILEFFGISNAILKINDSGALPFVISARLEAAVKKIVDTDLEYLPEIMNDNIYATRRDRYRFSRLYIPGNTPSLMINAGLHAADGIILDLEDSVAPEKKDEARILVRNALRQIGFNGAEKMVRINQGETGLRDLEFVVPHFVNLILVPKCEDPGYLKRVETRIRELKEINGLSDPVYLMPIIESALGVEMAYEIARSSEDIVAMAIGLEDLTADLGINRTKEGGESLYARTRIVYASKAAGIQPIDSVFSDVGDMDTLLKNVIASKALGFEGMGCIHPRQVPVIRKGFSPQTDEIEKSKKIVLAYEDARKKGLGVTTIGTKMIDMPVVMRALKVMDHAVRLGLVPSGWMEEDPEKTTKN
jgi:citrate lyase subunit beta / citryl-CoA lyase